MCALSSLALAGAFAAIVQAQENKPVAKAAATPTPSQTIQLKAAKNTPLQIALDKKVRLQKTVQALHGRIVEGTRLRGSVLQVKQAAPPKTRFLTTTVAIGVDAASFLGDTFGDTGPPVSGGAGGYKLIGIAVGLAVHSQSPGMAIGSFGAVRSIYTNFVARGPEPTFPNTAMQIGIAPPRPDAGEKAAGTETPRL